ncbi:RagB/SusD family nutrient uptake outer membrane protein [Prevotella sp.]|uniref:RagB/SusD family nutrient uptake outer membrane protein n=1 Tax=Prevotella sp. TaxID=59823 RepID=UPI002F937330
MKRNLHFIAILTACMLMQACSWFDVGSKSDVDVDEMYRSADGYYTTLTGLYVSLGDAGLYGANLPLLALEPLTQQYSVSENDPDRLEWSKFNYATDEGEKIISEIWLSMYNTIVNDNLLLSKFDDHSATLLSKEVADLMHGEALALRAYMYFDLLRMFSPAYKVDREAKHVPFKNDFGATLGARQSTAALLEQLVSDLTTARSLLKKDPILTGQSINNKYITYNRQQRMNYYAATALLARIELYREHYDRAAAYAQEVINSKRFRFVKPEEVSETDAYGVETKSDRIFMPEMIFALYDETILSASRAYYEVMTQDFVKSTDAYGENDVRRAWFFRNPSANNKINFIRYQRSTLTADSHKYGDPVVPLLKLSEMYLIAAECALHDKTTSSSAPQLLNALKSARGQAPVNATASENDIRNEITHEYICDFKGEGQLFYYYKRLNLPTIDDGHYNGNTIALKESDYTFPLPQYENQFGYGK